MGGGGGGGYKGVSPAQWERLNAAYEADRETLNSRIDDLLAEKLVAANARNTDELRDRIKQIAEILGKTADVEQMLYGGSVGKHTAVEGISDIDLLAIIESATALSGSPKEFLATFTKELHAQLSNADIESVTPGTLAATVKYRDGTEVQVLPAVRKGTQLMVGAKDGQTWTQTAPKAFRDVLTKANEKTNGQVVRVVKLFKVINERLPAQKQLTGYHIEALAVEAAKNYTGALTPRMFLSRFLEVSSERVLSRISDVTRQSRYVDDYLGRDNSVERRNVAQTLLGLKRRLDAATSLGEWKAVFGD